MNTEKIALFRKYMDGKCSHDEIDQIVTSLENGAYQQEWDMALANDAQNVMDSELTFNTITEPEVEALNKRILNSLNTKPTVLKMPLRNKWLPGIAIAASLLAIVSFGIFFFSTKDSVKNPDTITYQNDVAPGKTGATLTLANGKKILINDALAGNIANETGIKIYKDAKGHIVYQVTDASVAGTGFNILSTTRGEQTQVLLQDGTMVYLNAESSLRYPASFVKQSKRQVTLTGEGYFEVAKDKQHPFIVDSRGQRVEVLGTHFNINSYSNEPLVKTTLLEGSVNVSSPLHAEILEPGKQALNNNGHIQVNAVDTDLAVAWKNNNFVFDVLNIKEIMRMLERWYNVEVVYTGEIPRGTFWGSVSRFDHISKVLVSLEATGKVHFEIKGRKVYVSP